MDDWLLLSFTPVFSILGVYLIFIFIGPKLMKDRKAFELKNVTRIYNVYQICSCFCIVVNLYMNGYSTRDLWIHSTEMPEEVFRRTLNLWYYGLVIRFAELFETVIFVLRKKQNQVSLLHLYHHIGTILGVFVTLKYDPSELLQLILVLLPFFIFSGPAWVFHAMTNNQVHVIMYSYYFLSSFDSLKNFVFHIKPCITVIQIAQLVFLFTHSLVVYIQSGSIMFLGSALNDLNLLNLFLKFYLQSFKKKLN